MRLPPKYDPTAMSQSAGETNDPLVADHRNFYKVEKWTKDGPKSIACSLPAAASKNFASFIIGCRNRPCPLD
jgi:hypothetical protein